MSLWHLFMNDPRINLLIRLR